MKYYNALQVKLYHLACIMETFRSGNRATNTMFIYKNINFL